MANPLPPGIPVSIWEERRIWYETEIAAIQKELAPVENGGLKLRFGGTEREFTDCWIAHLRHTIQHYQATSDALNRGELL